MRARCNSYWDCVVNTVEHENNYHIVLPSFRPTPIRCSLSFNLKVEVMQCFYFEGKFNFWHHIHNTSCDHLEEHSKPISSMPLHVPRDLKRSTHKDLDINS